MNLNRKDRNVLSVSWLDVKLGIRMLAKYPGLSIVAVSGMALAIAIGAGYFAFIGAMLDSAVPVDQGQRLVVVRTRHIAGPEAGEVTRATAFDFVHWRGALKTVTELGAFRDESYNLRIADENPQPVKAAAITTSGFRLTRVAPLVGRTLLDEDERPGAPPVLVIGYEAWQRQFHGDARVIGRTVRLDETVHAIVGVMPEGFGFPVRHAFREITATVDATLKLERVGSVLQAWNFDRRAMSLVAVGIIAVTLSVLLLSAAGIYAMMSFTVSRRRREIGIRSALGADARRIVAGIFGRASAQLGAGIAGGVAIAAALEWLGPGGTMGGNALIILPSVVTAMFTVGVLAAIGPARRGLAVQPTEALREE
jgi:MacB-like periplasmic core domain/FtsX-like permease family